MFSLFVVNVKMILFISLLYLGCGFYILGLNFLKNVPGTCFATAKRSVPPHILAGRLPAW